MVENYIQDQPTSTKNSKLDGANIQRAAMLKFVECQISKFKISKYTTAELLQFVDFHYGSIDLELRSWPQKLNMSCFCDAENLRQRSLKSTWTFWAITSAMSQLTKQ